MITTLRSLKLSAVNVSSKLAGSVALPSLSVSGLGGMFTLTVEVKVCVEERRDKITISFTRNCHVRCASKLLSNKYGATLSRATICML